MSTIVKIIDKDRGFKALKEIFKQTKKSLAVGILSKDAESSYSNGTTLYDVAVANEFGTTSSLSNVHIPARPFISGTIDNNQGLYEQDCKKAALAIIDRKETPITAIKKLGKRIVRDIHEAIIAHIPPPNADETVKRKGSSTPLVDTGHLLGSVHYEVRDTASFNLGDL